MYCISLSTYSWMIVVQALYGEQDELHAKTEKDETPSLPYLFFVGGGSGVCQQMAQYQLPAIICIENT